MKSDKFECGDFTRENMPVQLLLAQVGHMYKWYVTKQMKDTELKAGQAGILAILQMGRTDVTERACRSYSYYAAIGECSSSETGKARIY